MFTRTGSTALGRIRGGLAIALAASVLFTAATPMAAGASRGASNDDHASHQTLDAPRGAFSDDDGGYYEAALDFLERRGVVAGTYCGAGRICPDVPIDRSTLAVWLGRALTGSEPATAADGHSRFADVDPDDWRAPHIERLAELEVTRGCGTEPLRYCGDGPVTRAHMAAFLVRAFDLAAAGSAGFVDTGGSRFEDHIDALAAAGVAGGCAVDPLRFCGGRQVTRGQMATFVARALGFGVAPTVTSDQKTLERVARLTGRLAPKSVVASGTGLYFAQNMMYQHTISVFDADKQLVKTLPDTVDLRAHGYDVAGDSYQGAPVEAAFTSDGSYAFVSNYRMYGAGYSHARVGDSCSKDQGERSFVYRIDTATLQIDRIYEAGPTPKFMAVTPDDGLLLVSNWCGYDVSVIDLRSHETLAEVPVGRYPRGIAITRDSATAYVAVMGSSDIAVLDLTTFTGPAASARSEADPGTGAPTYLRDVGISPRHLVLGPADSVLYATLNAEHAVVALDPDTGQQLARTTTGTNPRTMDISDDGTALYVVNYRSDTMTVLRADDLAVLQTLHTAPRPIGVTYDSFNDEVWVSTYSGVIHVYAAQDPPAPACAPEDCEPD